MFAANRKIRLILLTGIYGGTIGISLSFIFVSLISLIFVSLSTGELQETLMGFIYLSVFFGLGIAGIPSGVIGLVTGFIVGTIFSQSDEKISNDRAVTIGLIVSLIVTGILFVALIIFSNDSIVDLYPLLFPAAVYIIGSCVTSMFVNRKFFDASFRKPKRSFGQ